MIQIHFLDAYKKKRLQKNLIVSNADASEDLP